MLQLNLKTVGPVDTLLKQRAWVASLFARERGRVRSLRFQLPPSPSAPPFAQVEKRKLPGSGLRLVRFLIR